MRKIASERIARKGWYGKNSIGKIANERIAQKGWYEENSMRKIVTERIAENGNMNKKADTTDPI